MLTSPRKDNLPKVRQQVSSQDGEHNLLQRLKDGQYYKCPDCQKRYKRPLNIRKHLSDVHEWSLAQLGELGQKPKKESTPARSESVLASFVEMALLSRDTYDAYRMCDGDRVFRNAKFEFLYCFPERHFKYRLWLWRMLAYDMALLSLRQAYQYRWNIVQNLQGGVDQNITNDNVVELQVRNIKKKVQT